MAKETHGVIHQVFPGCAFPAQVSFCSMSIDDLCHMDNCFSSMTAITKHSSFSFQSPFDAVNHSLGCLPAVAFRTIFQHGMGHCTNQSVFLIGNNVIISKHAVIAVQSVLNGFYAVGIVFRTALLAAFSHAVW